MRGKLHSFPRYGVGMQIILILLSLTMGMTASAQPDSCQPIFHITGENSSSFFGSYIGACSGQNGDGCDEFLVSSQNPEEVMMFYGGTNLNTIPDMI